MLSRRHFVGAALAAGGVAHPFDALAQAPWSPTRTVKFIVPFPAGGAIDQVGRAFSNDFNQRHPTGSIVENKPGAGTTIGAQAMLNAEPDGHTLLIGSGGLVTSSLLYDKVPFRVPEDFTFITKLADLPHVIVVSPQLPVHTVGELIAYAKANPGKLNMGSSGTGTSIHLFGELFQKMVGIRMTHVPYAGSSQSLPALISDQVQMVADTLSTSLALIRANRIRVLAVTTSERVPQLPDVPTVTEAGLKDYVVSTWTGLIGRSNLPAPIVSALSTGANAALADRAFRQQLETLGILVPKPHAPKEFASSIEKEIGMLRPLIKQQGIKLSM